MNKYHLFTGKLACLFCLAGVMLTAAASAASGARQPNILVILADDLGYGELSCQGYTQQIPTPNIDSIAKNGIRFTSGYVSCPYCSPTRAGFMTGRYQQRFGHEFNLAPAQTADGVRGLSLSEKTIGDRLKAAGYKTGWFGKSHLGYKPEYHPLSRGFDEYFGFLGAGHDYLDAASDSDNPIQRGRTPVDELDYTTDAFGREAVNFIEKHKDEPWFCYLAFNAVHSPLQSTGKYLARFANIADTKRRIYAAMQSAMDDAVGAVLAIIQEHRLEEGTLIFFFSDNGGPTPQTTSGNGPLRGFKGETWEGGTRIPFMVQWKDHLPAGKLDDRPVIQLDILPTALAAAGVTIQPEWKLDGVNLLPYLSGENTGLPHEALYWRSGVQMALRMGDWKLVKGIGSKGVTGIEQRGKASTDGAELYNLKADLAEKENLAEKEPAKLQQLATAWNKWNGEMVDPGWYPDRSGMMARRPGMRRPGGAGTDATAPTGASLETRFKAMAGGKTTITREDMRRYAAQQGGPLASRPQLLNWVFDQLDENKDGVLTLDEYKKISEIRATLTNRSDNSPRQTITP